MKQARQFITHRHISLNQKEITAPSYLVSLEEENMIRFKERSGLSDETHPERINITKEVHEEAEKVKPDQKENKEKKTENKKVSPKKANKQTKKAPEETPATEPEKIEEVKEE